MILRTIKCDVCGSVHTEPSADDGFEGWGQLQGVCLDGVDNPSLCPQHLTDAANFIDGLRVKNALD